MARTRSKPKSRESAAESAQQETTSKQLEKSESNPPKLFVLPKHTSKRARIITLDNPATSKPNRYFVCPEKGLYEFIKVTAPNLSPRSWLLARPGVAPSDSYATDPDSERPENSKYFESSKDGSPSSLSFGYVVKNPDLFIATPMDVLFLLLPILSPVPAELARGMQKQMFLTLDDHLDSIATQSSHLKNIFQHQNMRDLAERAMHTVCDTVEAGEEIMYRISTEKLLQELLGKARRMVTKGLPTSLEERVVRHTLQKPMFTVYSEESKLKDGGTEEINAEKTAEDTWNQNSMAESSARTSQASSEFQTSIATTSQTSFTSTPIPEERDNMVASTLANLEMDAPSGIPELLRIRTCLDFILSSYLPPHLKADLTKALESNTVIDFTPLNSHLAHLSKLRAEAFALRSISANLSQKRPMEDDDEAAQVREEKKRKKEEEEKKRKAESRGIKELRKVNVSGMKKLSEWFGKPKAKASK